MAWHSITFQDHLDSLPHKPVYVSVEQQRQDPTNGVGLRPTKSFVVRYRAAYDSRVREYRNVKSMKQEPHIDPREIAQSKAAFEAHRRRSWRLLNPLFNFE